MSAATDIMDLKKVYKNGELRIETGRMNQYHQRKSAADKLQGLVQEYLTGEYGTWDILMDTLWETLCLFSGYPFYTAKGLRYSYTIKGYEMFVSRKDKSITKASVEVALKKALELQEKGETVTGPKKLKIFGASYIYPVFVKIGVID